MGSRSPHRVDGRHHRLLRIQDGWQPCWKPTLPTCPGTHVSLTPQGTWAWSPFMTPRLPAKSLHRTGSPQDSPVGRMA